MGRTMAMILTVLGFVLLQSGCAGLQSSARTGTTIVLVGHGAPAKDYPEDRLQEWFRISAHSHAAHGHEQRDDHDEAYAEYARREREIREWPRTPENDPYKHAVEAIGKRLAERTGCPVLAAFHEFCAPTVEEAIDEGVQRGAKQLVIITTMMTPSNEHSEVDIPRSIDAARRQHPNVRIVYAWPYDMDRLVTTFADQIEAFEPRQP